MKHDIFGKNSSLGLIFRSISHESVRIKSNVLKNNKVLLRVNRKLEKEVDRCLEPLDVFCITIFID